MTIYEARDLLIKKHREALDAIHAIVTESPTITNNEWSKLTQARQNAVNAAGEIMAINQTIQAVEKLAKQV
jgi:hypothetical protein